jgi:hypothetical protein
MDYLKIAKFAFAMSFIWGYATLALGTALLPALLIIPVTGPWLLATFGSLYVGLGILSIPVFLAVSLKLLSWIDEGMGEFKIRLNLRGSFIKFRSSLVRNFPGELAKLINLVT